MWYKVQNSENLKEDYINKNTFLLTPSLLKEYLARTGLIKKEKRADKNENENSSSKDELKKFLNFIAQNPSEDDFLKTFTEKPDFIDLFVTIALESYEFLCRILIVLDKCYREHKIKDRRLKKLIDKVKKDRREFLPRTSIELKNEVFPKKPQEKPHENPVKNLVVFILYKMFSEDFGNYYAKNISDGVLHESLGKSLSLLCGRITTIEMLAKLIKNHSEIESQILELLSLVYSSKSKGMRKAKEGIRYEEILKDVLDFHKIPHELEEKEDEGSEDVEISAKTRKWDIYIPDKSSPKIVIEVMYMITTSSGMTNKRKVIISESKDAKRSMKIFALMDGAGWIARWSDAKKILEAEVHTFTFHKDSLEEAIRTIKSHLKNSAR